jgi:hypothetical protein
MKTVWYQSLPKDRQDQFKQTVLGAKIVLDKAIEILYNKVQDENSVKQVDYESPSWSHKQADRLGFIRGLQFAIDLLSLDQKTDRNV